ncbi:conjugal transfer protein [Nocardiopsis alba]|uniref:Conjugative transposon TcpC family protein n=1 Tax=Nocardiopsis alba (strain ATCC BAA-2165 / BE74) TaxID=1205910 RepID=J7LHR0_NOCAA|nr:conjugal transfer protein [Nocardiopsis alba]AFR10474.1 conjugative transposon TcpC family protein [Nocardiopsis alba ATCC BAA-2165]
MVKTSRRDTAVRDRADDDHDLDAPRPRRPKAGAGGRWWVGVGRVLLWAFIIVVIFNGIWFPIRNGFSLPSSSSADTETTEAPAFPEAPAAAFALRFADTYLDTSDLEARQSALVSFVPEGEVGSLNVPADGLTGENLTVVAVDVLDDHNALVVVRADVNGEPMSLQVPVYSADDALVLSGPPALLAAPAQASLPEGVSYDTDSQAAEQLRDTLSGFFEVYAEEAGHLDRYVEPGVSITPLPANTLEFHELSDIAVPSQSSTGDDDVRQVAATVLWSLPSGDAAGDGGNAGQMVQQNYLVTVVDSGSEWYVRDIQGAPHSFGG